MKFSLRFLLLIFSFTLLSCGSEDDICLSSEGTPRIKMKFKDSNGKLLLRQNLTFKINYGEEVKTFTATSADSVLLPLRIDESNFTDIEIGSAASGPFSQLRVNYDTKSEYVSPACGIRRLYENINANISGAGPVKSVETNQTSVTDENKTHLYLIF